MAKRMASSAEAQKTSSRINPRRKYRNSLRSTSASLRAQAAPGKSCGHFLGWGLLLVVIGPAKRFVLAGRISQSDAHEVHPDRQSRFATGFVPAQRLLFVESDPHAAGNARREADEPRVGVIVGSPGLAGQRMVELARGPARPV